MAAAIYICLDPGAPRNAEFTLSQSSRWLLWFGYFLFEQLRRIWHQRSRVQNTVEFPIGRYVNVLSDYKETVPEN